MLVPEGAMAARGEMLMAFFVLFELSGRPDRSACGSIMSCAHRSRRRKQDLAWP
jgi:hypothetical protein